mmetsp:Transcript_52214/g.122169  ORF Transcript_52214/g.122169 Transcript_52214/m.122169 type:complete len:835 (+) Transcript_52214:132-2636(+)
MTVSDITEDIDEVHSQHLSWKQLKNSYIFNIEIFLIAVGLWLAATSFRRISRRWNGARAGFKDALLAEFHHAALERSRIMQPTAAECNYLNFLWLSMCLCLTLTVVNGAFLAAANHLEALWFGQSCITVFGKAARYNLHALIGMAIVDGIVALLFGIVLAVLAVNEGTQRVDDADRTLWLSSLPSVDKQTWFRFQLTDADIKEVEHDIGHALDKEFRRYGMLDAHETAVESCIVVPVLDKWEKLRQRHATVLDDIQRCQILLEQSQLCPAWTRWKLKSRLREHEKLQDKLLEALAGLKGLSGSAFVTFKHRSYQEHLIGSDHTTHLASVPEYLSRLRQLRPYSYFSFGRPPFGSVTLCCRRAPLPTDVEWRNLHIRWSEGRFAGYSALLFVVMFLLVTPTTMLTVVPALAEFVKIEMTIKSMRDTVSKVGTNSHGWPISHDAVDHLCKLLDSLSSSSVLQELPTLVLLAINSLALPYAIEYIALGSHCKLKSESETKQKVLNQTFLIVNTLIFPLLGVGSLTALVKALRGVHDDSETAHGKGLGIDEQFVHLIVRQIVLGSPGMYSLKYLMNAAFISSAIAITNLPQTIIRGLQRARAVTDQEKAEANTPWPFAWGYWYAWAVSALVLTVVVGVLVPSVYPIASVLFFLRYAVDRHNLKWGVYGQGAGAGRLAVKAACDVPLTVAGCWAQWALVAMLAPRLFAAAAAEDEDGSPHWDLQPADARRLFWLGMTLFLAAVSIAAAAKMWLLMHKCVSERGHHLSVGSGQWLAKKLHLHWPSTLDAAKVNLVEHDDCVESAGHPGADKPNWDYKLHVEYSSPREPPPSVWQVVSNSC